MDTTIFTSEGRWMLFFLALSVIGIMASIIWNARIYKRRKYLGHLFTGLQLQRSKEKEIWTLVILIFSSIIFISIINALFFEIK